MGRQEIFQERVQEWLLRLQKCAPAELPDQLVDAVAALTGAERVLFLRQDPELMDWVPCSARGMAPATLSGLRIESYDGLPRQSILEQHLSKPLLSCPLRTEDRLTGYLAAANPAGESFSDNALRLMTLLAGEVSAGLAREAMSRDFRDVYTRAVAMMGGAVEAKDVCTYTHLSRTQRLVRALASEMKLPEQWIGNMEQGAYLHDLGKIGIPDAILNKPGPLTDEEYRVIKNHPEIGRRILGPAAYLNPAAAIVLYHHEWFNGQGYPEGLAGNEIPLGARLVQIVDAWDAMTSDRPYRKAMTKTAAIAELRRQSGTQFDPKIIDLFLKVLERMEREGVATTE